MSAQILPEPIHDIEEAQTPTPEETRDDSPTSTTSSQSAELIPSPADALSNTSSPTAEAKQKQDDEVLPDPSTIDTDPSFIHAVNSIKPLERSHSDLSRVSHHTVSSISSIRSSFSRAVDAASNLRKEASDKKNHSLKHFIFHRALPFTHAVGIAIFLVAQLFAVMKVTQEKPNELCDATTDYGSLSDLGLFNTIGNNITECLVPNYSNSSGTMGTYNSSSFLDLSNPYNASCTVSCLFEKSTAITVPEKFDNGYIFIGLIISVAGPLFHDFFKHIEYKQIHKFLKDHIPLSSEEFSPLEKTTSSVLELLSTKIDKSEKILQHCADSKLAITTMKGLNQTHKLIRKYRNSLMGVISSDSDFEDEKLLPRNKTIRDHMFKKHSMFKKYGYDRENHTYQSISETPKAAKEVTWKAKFYTRDLLFIGFFIIPFIANFSKKQENLFEIAASTIVFIVGLLFELSTRDRDIEELQKMESMFEKRTRIADTAIVMTKIRDITKEYEPTSMEKKPEHTAGETKTTPESSESKPISPRIAQVMEFAKAISAEAKKLDPKPEETQKDEKNHDTEEPDAAPTV